MKIMRKFIGIIVVIAFFLCPNTGLCDDCSKANELVKQYKNNENELLKLGEKYPECGKVQIVLGNYYYENETWLDSYKCYRKALKFFPKNAGLRNRTSEMEEKYPVCPIESKADIKVASRIARTRGLGGAKKLPPLALCIKFDVNRAEIKADGKALLDEFARMLKTNFAGYRFDVQGHTDNTGPKENKLEYNMNLSRERALSVKNYLADIGISPDKLEVEYYAYDKPIATNLTKEGRRQNRRVQFEGHRVYR